MIRLIIFLMFISGISANAQSKCTCPDLNKLRKENISDTEISTKLITLSDKVCKAKGYEMMARKLTDELKLDSAEIINKKAEKLFISSSCSDTILLNVFKTQAQIHYSRADFVKAQVYSLKLINCAEKAGNFFELALGCTMTAQLFNQTNQAEKGIIYTRKAAKLLPKLPNDKRFSIISFLASRYLWHYQDTGIKTSLDSVEMYSIQYLKWAKSIQDNRRICKAFNLVQAVAYERKDFNTAIALLDSSYVYIDKSNSEASQIYFYDKADIYLELNDPGKAQICADSALHFALKNKNPAYIAEAYDLQERVGNAKGDYKQAYDMRLLKNAINDSIRTVEKTQAVTELEKKYHQAKNEITIKDLEKKNQFYLLLALSGLFALLTLGLYLRHQKLKHQQNILETEQRLNRARMNPHFFFNALASLQKFALRDNDGQALASNLSKFSNIMRETLESTYKEYITIEQEMDFLNEYLEVQKIRFPKTFSYTIYAHPDMEVDDILIPSMILQPFIENSIEHGFSGIEYPGHVDIKFGIHQNELMIEVEDNGKGLSTAIKEQTDHISRAGQIIKDRIYLLNIKLKTKAGFSFDNNKNGLGTIVKIHLPLLFKSTQDVKQ
ncbi:MAG: histidine kinase [Saprospiraceae bacterium]|nr:histidine kinase [Saprospiraceae bacterium]MBK6566161.1 histidine kinase [Saprospiraceae bacterium]MBK8369820.1 histidine kinase [Saprospiraceae bacterium]MBK8548193.1 histidine kinase [Saprospiraceae bacterium]MBK9043425.1 histidine kinase [Saprospiraceae bacterium]